MPNDTKLSSCPERRDRALCVPWCFWQQATATNKMSRVPTRLKTHHFLFVTLRYAAKANEYTGPTLPATWCISMSFIIGLTRPSDSASELLAGDMEGSVASTGLNLWSTETILRKHQWWDSANDSQTAAFSPLSHSCSCTKHEAWIFSCTHSLVFGSWSCIPCGNMHEWYKNNRILCTGGPSVRSTSSAAFEFYFSTSEHLFAPFTLWLCTTFLFGKLISSKPI